MKGQIIITLSDEGRLNVNAPKDKILAYGMMVLAIETMMKNPPKKIIDIPDIIPPRGIAQG